MTSFTYEEAVKRLAKRNGWLMYMNDLDDIGFLWAEVDIDAQSKTLRIIYPSENAVNSAIAKVSMEEYKKLCKGANRNIR